MIKPETFKKYTLGEYMWHCKLSQLDEVFKEENARKLASFFEFMEDKPCENRYKVSAERARFINETIAGRRPELAAQIWKIVYELARDQDAGIGALDVSFLQDMDVDLGTVILLLLILEETQGDLATPLDLVNRNGSKIISMKSVIRGNTGKNFVLETSKFQLSEQIVWTYNHVYIPTLPDTIKVGLQGKYLKNLISHPLIDHMILTITGVDEAFGQMIRTDYYPEVLSIADLAKSELEKLAIRRVAV